jgi:hypothetical protein
MPKKQTKADKAFIAKIGTLGIKTSSAKKTCPDCGTEMQPIGHLEGEVHGQKMSGPIYGHPGQHPGPRRNRAEPVAESSDEQSLSA